MFSRLLGRRPESSDSIPLDVIAPVEELRLYLDGEISEDEYEQAIRRGEDALVNGWRGEDSEPTANGSGQADPAIPA